MSDVLLPIPRNQEQLLEWAQSLTEVVQSALDSGVITTTRGGGGLAPTYYDNQGRVILDGSGHWIYDADGNLPIAPDIVQIDTSNLVDAAITTAKIANLAVDTEKLAALSVDAAKLATGAVTEIKIFDSAVTASKIADLAVTAGKLADGSVSLSGNKITGQLAGVNLADAAVDAQKLADLSVEAAKLASSAKSLLVNSVENPDFEAGQFGWSTGGAVTIVNDPVNARTGDWCGKFTNATSEAFFNSKQIQVEPGDRVLGQAFFKMSSGSGGFDTKIRWLDSAGNTVAYVSGNAVTTSTYTQSRVVAVAPAAAVRAQLVLDSNGTVADNNGYVDGAYMSIIPKDTDIDVLQTNNAGEIVGSHNPITASNATTYIGTAAIGTAAIANAAITNAKIGNLAVDTAQIADAAISSAKIQNLAVGNAAIANAAIDTAKIEDAAITSAKIANLAVGTAAIAAAAVGTAQIANAAITSALIQDAAIITAKIDDLAVNNAKLANLSVSSAKIQDLAVTNAKIASLAANKITTGTLAATETIEVGGAIYSGKTSYTSTLAGFWLGVDAGAAKLHIGGPSNRLQFTGTDLLLQVQRIGSGATAGTDSIAFGDNSAASGVESVAIGVNALASDTDTIAIGYNAQATNDNDTAIGVGAAASGDQSIAIGTGATASHPTSVAIGTSASSTASLQITLGGGSEVRIPGTLNLNSGQPNTIGQVALMLNDSGVVLEAGDTTAASNLSYASVAGGTGGTPTPSGTWRCLGYASAGVNADTRTSVFVRVA